MGTSEPTVASAVPDRNTGLGRALAEPTALERLRSIPSHHPALPDALLDSPDAPTFDAPQPMAETPEGARRRAEALEHDAVIEIVITPLPRQPTPNTVVGGHNEEDHNTGGEGGGTIRVSPPVQGAPTPQPRVTTATVTIDSPGTLRPTVPSLETARIPRATLLLEAAPDWIRRLPPQILVPLLLSRPRPAGDTQVFGFPIADDVRVVLDGTTREPGRVEVDGVDIGILVHPVHDDDGEITGFAPDSYFDQDELHRLTGVWVALSENGSAQDTTIVVVGDGSRRGPPARVKGSTEERRAARAENRSGVLIADKEGRNLEQIRNTGKESTPDYIDIDTKERFDIYTPQGFRVETIRTEVRTKMKKDQADIIVVNTYYSPLPLSEILRRIDSMARDRPVTVIDKEGEFHYFEPNANDPADLIAEPLVSLG